MRTLTFLHNHLKETIAWLIKDDMGVIYEKGTASTFSELQAKDVDRLEGFIFSPLFSNKRLEVPPASKSQILESIPFLLEDNILGSIEDYHFAVSSRSEEGEVTVSVMPINSIEDEIHLFNKAQVNVNSLCLLDNSFKEKSKTSFLAIFDEIAVINFESKWGWCAETNTILTLLEKSLKDFESTSLKVFQNKRSKKINWNKYTKLEPDIVYVSDELDFLGKTLPLLENKLNLLKDKYAPKIPWKTYFEKWKYGLAAASIAIALYFSQIIVDIYQNNTIAIDLLEESESLYYSGFPNEPKVEDLEKLIRQKLKGLEFSGKEPFLLTIQNLTQVIFNNERVSLYSINYELNRNQFVIEIQCSEFEDLEAVKSTFSLGGYSVDIGSSKRVGNSILSEIFIKKT